MPNTRNMIWEKKKCYFGSHKYHILNNPSTSRQIAFSCLLFQDLQTSALYSITAVKRAFVRFLSLKNTGKSELVSNEKHITKNKAATLILAKKHAFKEKSVFLIFNLFLIKQVMKQNESLEPSVHISPCDSDLMCKKTLL